MTHKRDNCKAISSNKHFDRILIVITRPALLPFDHRVFVIVSMLLIHPHSWFLHILPALRTIQSFNAFDFSIFCRVSFISIDFSSSPSAKEILLWLQKTVHVYVILFTLFNNFTVRKVYSLHVVLLLDFLILIFLFFFGHCTLDSFKEHRRGIDTREETDIKSCTKRMLKDSQR